MANKENQPPTLPLPQISSISPGNKPALGRQRDHSACRRPETPLRVRKTRDNLKQCSIYADIPPPCLHLHDHEQQPQSFNSLHAINHLTPAPDNAQRSGLATNELVRNQHTYQSGAGRSTVSFVETPGQNSMPRRQRSVKQRMLTRVKQGIANYAKTTQPFRAGEADSNLVRRFSGRRKKSGEAHSRSQSFEISRDSIDSQIEESFDSTTGPQSVERSFSGTSVSTADVLDDSSITTDIVSATAFTDRLPVSDGTEIYTRTPSPCSSRSPQPTPRPPRAEPPALPHIHARTINIVVPSVKLDVQMDITTLNVNAKLEVWVAVKATVNACQSSMTLEEESKQLQAPPSDSFQSSSACQSAKPLDKCVCGSITSLRICYKPIGGCRIRAVLGQKSLRDLNIGQEALLFIKLHIPRLRMSDSTAKMDTDSLFADLESMVGTLETDILHVEARYRNSLLPSNNVITVRHDCTIMRPRTESRWSMITSSDIVGPSNTGQTRLADYIKTHYNPDEASVLMQEHLDPDVLKQSSFGETGTVMVETASQNSTGCSDGDKPSVIVTDIDDNPTPLESDAAADQFCTAPSTPVTNPPETLSVLSTPKHNRRMSSISLPVATNKLAPPLLSAPKTTIALSEAQSSQDSARELWHHIRRTSLSARQLEELPAKVECLEQGDVTLKELRRKALANKRSVGAETLKDWKWEESVGVLRPGSEAPWM